LRNFAKDYLMVDAFPPNKEVFKNHFGDTNFVAEWYKKLPAWHSQQVGHFEFITSAIGNVSDAGDGTLTLDLCDGRTPGFKTAPCPSEINTPDMLIPGKLSAEMREKVAQAQSAYIKIDVEGLDQAAIDGMRNLLNETRGTYADGKPRYLVDFMMLEFCPDCMEKVQKEKGLPKYDLSTNVAVLESLGFEVFLMGPRYLPLSHGSWLDDYNTFSFSPTNSPLSGSYPSFRELICPGAWCREGNFFAADLFAMRSSQPHATQIKLSLGSCKESREFSMEDPQYA